MSCRWVIADNHVRAIRDRLPEREIYCCAAVVEPGSAWCREHRARVYVKPTRANLASWHAVAGLGAATRRPRT